MKTAFITGITGQDGAILAEMLLEKSYKVHGVVRRASLRNTQRIEHLLGNPNLELHYGDVIDAGAIMGLVQDIQPQEIYNLAAQSDVHVSFEMPAYTFEVNTKGALNLLEAMRRLPEGSCKFYQASTSEIFGNSNGIKNESTKFYPCSPYGVSKLSAYWNVVSYRNSYGLFAINGILFNHESPLRGECFVSRKISLAVAEWKNNNSTPIKLGNLDAKRDWGHARDYVEGIWAALQQGKPEDFVLATGESHSVREFVELAFSCIDREIKWQGEGTNEQGFDKETNDLLVAVDPNFFRPVDIDALCGDATKAKEILNWEPKTKFKELVKEMVEADIAGSKYKKNVV